MYRQIYLFRKYSLNFGAVNIFEFKFFKRKYFCYTEVCTSFILFLMQLKKVGVFFSRIGIVCGTDIFLELTES